MLFRTHIAFGIFLVLLFLGVVEERILFFAVVLIATALVDIDTEHSRAGKFLPFRIVQFFVKHRGVIHSLTFSFVFALVLSSFYPLAGFAFFIGAGGHIFLDSFTRDGVAPFWPSKKVSKGFVRTGGRIEGLVFAFLVFVDVVFGVWRVF
ncbi:MAG: metal-dependent hydrolase [Nanoarchaeota archaeon]